MADPVKPSPRPYHAPQRAAAAARTREAIMTAAKDAFERLGWPGATMRGIADQAGVSVKTVEALYRTKAELLKHVVDYAIAGDLRSIPVTGREPVAAMQAAPDVTAMLDLHARQVTDISGRSAQIFWVVEQAAPADQDIAGLWAQMSEQPALRCPLGSHHPAGQARRATPRRPGLRRGGVLARHRPRHIPQPHPRTRPEPSRPSKPGSGTSTTRCSCTSPRTVHSRPPILPRNDLLLEYQADVRRSKIKRLIDCTPLGRDIGFRRSAHRRTRNDP